MLNELCNRSKISICLPVLMALLASSRDAEATGSNAAGVTIYERADFGGDSRVLVADVSDLADIRDPCCIGDANWSDCMSSIQLSPGWTATLCELEGFEGDSRNVTSSISNLESFPGCDVDWNNCAKSMRVQR